MTDEFEGLNLVELIALLEAAPEPTPVSMMPQTVGWAILAAAGVLAIFLGVWWILRRHKAHAYRRAALRELAMAGDDPAVVAGILRRTALRAFPRDSVTPLTGPAWLTFLDESFDGTGFVDGPGQVFAIAPYQPQGANGAATALAGDWIRRHRAAVGGS